MGSPFFQTESDPDLADTFDVQPDIQRAITRPAPPEPTSGRALRDISKALKGDEQARAGVLGSNTLDEMEGKPPSQLDSLVGLGASSAMDPTEKLLFASARGTRAQEQGDEAFDAIKRERAKRALETSKIEREQELVEGGDPMERTLEAQKQEQEFEGMLPYGERPVAKVGLPGGEMIDMAPSAVPVGQPSYEQARKYAEARGVAEARGTGTRASGAALAPGGSVDIGGRRIRLTEQMQKDLHTIDTDQTLSSDQRRARQEAILRRASVIADILSGKGGSGYFPRPLPGQADEEEPPLEPRGQ